MANIFFELIVDVVKVIDEELQNVKVPKSVSRDDGYEKYQDARDNGIKVALAGGDELVVESLAMGSSHAKVQLDAIQEMSFSLSDDTLAYLVFFFYLAKRLGLVADELEGRFREEYGSMNLREFVEKKAISDDAKLSLLKGLLTSDEEVKE